MKRLLFFACLALSAHVSFAQKDMNVLFIGNSLTYCDARDNSEFPYYNNMTEMLQKMIEEKKLKIHVEKVTHAHASMAAHATFVGTDNEASDEPFKRAGQGVVPSSVKRIQSKQWDVVALQERADVSVLIPAQRAYSTEPALKYLDGEVKKAHGKVVLYQGYAEQHPVDTELSLSGQKQGSTNCVVLDAFNFGIKPIDFYSTADESIFSGKDTTLCSDPLPPSVTEAQAISQELNKLAAGVGGDVVEIGPAFEKCRKDYPAIKLYYDETADHPSKQGAYLIACLFFKYLSGQPVSAIKYHADITESEAANLRKVADAVHTTAYSRTLKTANSK